MSLATLAQTTPPLPVNTPEFAWAAISPELVLFGVGILVLLLDTAGQQRLQASFAAMGVLVAGAVVAAIQTGNTALSAMVGLGAVAQFALTAIWRDRPRMLAAILAALGFAGGFGVSAWQWATYAGGLVATVGDTQVPLVGTASLIADMVASDGVALFTRFTVCSAGFITVLLGFSYAETRRMHRGEYYPLLLFAATGMTLLAASADLIMVFIAIEVLSLSLYILTGFAKRDLNSQEGAFKYFLLGAFSSALLLYGIAIAYGVAGTTNIAEVGRAFSDLEAEPGLVLTSMALMLVGFAFKTSVVPFHMWTPDVYQGAPTPVTGFMAAATKAAAFAAFLRVFVGALAPLQWSWTAALWVLAVATMLAGAVLAVVQDDVKRMLGYSAIAHAGYVLIGLIAATREGVSSVLFYLLVYAFMSLGSFGVLALFERRSRKAMGLADLRGIGRRYPLAAGMMALFLLSLAGIPGTAGFMAKFAVFRAGIEAGQWALVVVAVVSSVIAAFFYIRVIVAMFFDPEPDDAETAPPVVTTPGLAVGLAATAAAVVVVGIVPNVLIDLAAQAASFAG
ncbi:MAG: NADH-quinone oxidoreductase subunit NuoN [Egibacteraceae bacterium]